MCWGDFAKERVQGDSLLATVPALKPLRDETNAITESISLHLDTLVYRGYSMTHHTHTHVHREATSIVLGWLPLIAPQKDWGLDSQHKPNRERSHKRLNCIHSISTWSTKMSTRSEPHRSGPLKQRNKGHKHGRHKTKGEMTALDKGVCVGGWGWGWWWCIRVVSLYRSRGGQNTVWRAEERGKKG